MNINDGGPAFPSHGTMGEVVQEGMTLRDYFAAKALQGFCSQAEPTRQTHFDNLAADAYQTADAMLKAREVSNGRS